jgi:hypothetical protein
MSTKVRKRSLPNNGKTSQRKKTKRSAITVEMLDEDLGMSYHDNWVQMPFSVPGGYNLVTAIFTVTDFSITSGQDPDGKNHIGDTKQYGGSNGSMDFVVGRSGSTDVATWWNNSFGGNRNTFNHNAGALNFAFKGNLHMELQGGIFGTNVVGYDLNNVAVAQGHSGTSNNWWFGGQDCVYQASEGDVVRCPAVGTSGYQLYLYFRRGSGTPVDTINCYKLEIPGFQTFSVAPGFVGETSQVPQAWLQRGYQVRMPPYVTYYTDQQSPALKLSVQNNLIYISINNQWTLFDTSGGDATFFSKGKPVAIWVLAPDGQLYASRAHKICMFHHSTILGGQPVAGAGEMSVSQGVIQSANNMSGHYLPTADVTKLQLIESLDRQGYSQTFTWTSVSRDELENAYPEIGDDETE